MGLADVAIRGIIHSVQFRASAAPYLLLDSALRIRAVNPAYQRATLRSAGDLVHELMFDAFPDNPATPEVRAVEALGTSFERALTTGAPDRMGLQRYDVWDPRTGRFVEKHWLPVNSTVRESDGGVVALLHHVEDVTHLLSATGLELELHEPYDSGAADEGTSIDALRRDAAARKGRALDLMDRSRAALERMHRRIDAESRDGAP